MKIDAAFEALKKANPEPDPTALRKALAETTVTVLDDTKTRQRPNPTIPTKPRLRPLWQPAFSAGLVVLMVVAAMLIPWTGSQSILDRIRTSPVEIASGYMEARNTFDAAAAARAPGIRCVFARRPPDGPRRARVGIRGATNLRVAI